MDNVLNVLQEALRSGANPDNLFSSTDELLYELVKCVGEHPDLLWRVCEVSAGQAGPGERLSLSVSARRFQCARRFAHELV